MKGHFVVDWRVGPRALGPFAVVWRGFAELERSSEEVVFVEDLWLRRCELSVAGVATTIELRGA
jgi:hypothetical protein